MRSLLAGWDTLDPALSRLMRANFLALSCATVGLALVWVGGFRHPNVEIDVAVMAVSLFLMVLSAPFTPRFGARAPIAGITASSTLFCLVGTWITPMLSPLTAMLMLVPLFVAMPYLPRRGLFTLMAWVLVGSVAVVTLAEYRRGTGSDWAVDAAIIGASLPTVVAVMIYLVYDSYRRIQSQAAELRDASTRVVLVADAARRGIERDLHDGAQQQLIAMSLLIERARVQLRRGDHAAAAQLIGQLGSENRQVVADLRELARGIYPPLLTQRGLVSAVQAAARRSPVPVTLHAGEFRRPSRQVEVAAYFCILEALTNVAKHSGASGVEVNLKGANGLEFMVRDDGVGFDVSTVDATGLLGMEARVTAAGGRLAVVSRPGHGTTVSGWFPDE